jgi:hypothetical protein
MLDGETRSRQEQARRTKTWLSVGTIAFAKLFCQEVETNGLDIPHGSSAIHGWGILLQF